MSNSPFEAARVEEPLESGDTVHGFTASAVSSDDQAWLCGPEPRFPEAPDWAGSEF